MKTKSLLFAMFMAPAVFTACSNEDIVEQVAQDAETIPGKDVTLVFQSTGANSRMDYIAGEEQADGTWTASSYKWQLGSTTPFSSVDAVDKLGLSRVEGVQGTSNYLFYPTKVISLGQPDWVADPNAIGKGAQFSTDNLTVYTGDYVAYYPYSENMVEDGPLTLTLKQAQVQSEADNTAHVAKNGFAVSDIIALEGGQQVNKDFTLSQLYGTMYFRLKGDAANFLSVSLESESAIFPTEATLDVTKLKSKKASELTASDLTFTEAKKVSHIDLTLNNAVNLDPTTYKTFYMTLMPGTYKNVSVVYKTYTGYYKEALKEFTVTPNGFIDVPRELNKADLEMSGSEDGIIVNDAASWKSALKAVTTVSNTTRVISVNAPIELKQNELFASTVNAVNGKVIVKGQPITIKDGTGSLAFKNVVFQNEVIIDKDVTTFTIPSGSDVTFENLDADNAPNATALTVDIKESNSPSTTLNLKNASIKGTVYVRSTASGNVTTLNIIEGGNVTTEGNLKADNNGNATVSVAKGATWNATKGSVNDIIKLDVDGNLNINEGSVFTFDTDCNFTNGTVAINGGKVNVAAAIAAVGTNPGDVTGTITNNSGTVEVGNTLFTAWAAAGKSASFTNKANYYAMGFTDYATVEIAIGNGSVTGATGFELQLTSNWTIDGENTVFNYDFILNPTTSLVSVIIDDNATCTINGNLTIAGSQKVTIKNEVGSKKSIFKVKNLTVNGELEIGSTSNSGATIELNCSSCYVAGGATLTNSSNLTGCTPTVDGTIIK